MHQRSELCLHSPAGSTVGRRAERSLGIGRPGAECVAPDGIAVPHERPVLPPAVTDDRSSCAGCQSASPVRLMSTCATARFPTMPFLGPCRRLGAVSPRGAGLVMRARTHMRLTGSRAHGAGPAPGRCNGRTMCGEGSPKSSASQRFVPRVLIALCPLIGVDRSCVEFCKPLQGCQAGREEVLSAPRHHERRQVLQLPADRTLGDREDAGPFG